MKTQGFVKIVLKSFVDFFKDNGLMLAGSVSYFFMMALVPFCLFIVTILATLFGEYGVFHDFFVAKVMSFFPHITSKITSELTNIVVYKGLGKFSLVIYALLSYQLFSSLESAINVIFKIQKKRSLFISLILSLISATFIISLFVISLGATSVISSLKIFHELFPELKIGKLTVFLIGVVVPFFIVAFTMTILYILLPVKRVKVAHAFTGGIFTAVFFEIAKHLFTFVVREVAQFGTIYGPLSAFIIFLLWVFYSSCILLIGAETVHNLGELRRRSPGM